MSKIKKHLIFWILLSASAFFLIRFHGSILNWGLTKYVNRAAQDSLATPLIIDRVALDSSLQLHLHGLSVSIRNRNEPAIKIDLDALHMTGSLFDLLTHRPVLLSANNLRINGSKDQGLHLEAYLILGRDAQLDLRGTLSGVDLKDLAWMDPDHLRGSSGTITGIFRIIQKGPDLSMEIDSQISPPGGNIQAEFFDLLFPFLPKTPDTTKLNKIFEGKRIVHFKEAKLHMRTVQADTLQGVFHIQIPEYNVVLNVNLRVRTDRENAFPEIARLLGLIEVKPS